MKSKADSHKENKFAAIDVVFGAVSSISFLQIGFFITGFIFILSLSKSGWFLMFFIFSGEWESKAARLTNNLVFVQFFTVIFNFF